MSTTPPSKNRPYPVGQVQRVLEMDRPELIELWEAEGTLPQHLARISLNATWMLERHRASKASWALTLTEVGADRASALMQAVGLATLDDLDRHNTFDRPPDAALLTETQLRSGWFSI